MSYALAFLLLLVPLVVFHELGHFVVAKLCRVRVSKFAFGFGRKLFGFHFKGTDYRWNLWPLGGYVDFMGEAVYGDRIPDDPRHFYNQSKGVRFFILVAGPLFNFILAFLLFWYVFAQPLQIVQFQGDLFTVGVVQPDSVEARAGLKPGDRILSYNDQEITSVDGFLNELALQPNKTIALEVERNGERLEIEYVNGVDSVEGIGAPGFSPAILAQVSNVQKDSPAAKAGLKSGDLITRINGQDVYYGGVGDISMVSAVLQEQTELPITISGLRDGQPFSIDVTPDRDAENKFVLGIYLMPNSRAEDPSWVEALTRSWNECTRYSTLIFRTLKKLGSGDLPIKSVSGPLAVGKYAKDTLAHGFWYFINLMAILSLNLGIVNMLPIPVLDGGEIFVLGVEWISRKNFELQTKMKIKLVGLVFLFCLMGTVLISDAVKIFMPR